MLSIYPKLCSTTEKICQTFRKAAFITESLSESFEDWPSFVANIFFEFKEFYYRLCFVLVSFYLKNLCLILRFFDCF